MAVISLYLDKRKKTSKEIYPIKFRVYHNSAFFISTGMYASPEVWDGKAYNRKELNYKVKNVSLSNKFNKLESELLLLGDKLKSMSDRSLKAYLVGVIADKPIASDNFLRYLDEYALLKEKKSTRDSYMTTRMHIVNFDECATFDTIDKKWLTRFYQYLSDKGYKINYIGLLMKNIRTVFNYAIDEEITLKYPFRKFKIKREQTRKRCLSVDELRLLRDYAVEPYQEIYRDIFMLIFYLIGINIEDLLYLTEDNVVRGRIEYYRHKTGKLFSVKMEPEAKAIINKYRGDKYLLNIMEERRNYTSFTAAMDRALKEIGEVKKSRQKKIRKPLFPSLSSYRARHSWATIGAELDIPKETLSAGLGHEVGSSITSIYIKFDRKKVDEANRRIIDYVNGKNKKGAQ